MLAKAIGERIEKRKRRLRRFMAERRLLFVYFLGEFERRGNGGNCLEESKVSNSMFSLECLGKCLGKVGFYCPSQRITMQTKFLRRNESGSGK